MSLASEGQKAKETGKAASAPPVADKPPQKSLLEGSKPPANEIAKAPETKQEPPPPPQQVTAQRRAMEETKAFFRSQAVREELQRINPDFPVDEMVGALEIAVVRNPKIAECSRPTQWLCAKVLMSIGLPPDGRVAHLIPFNNSRKVDGQWTQVLECTYIIDYKGMVKLAYNSGEVRSISASIIHEGDLFDYQLENVLHHTKWEWRRDHDKPRERGRPIGAYVIIKLKYGEHHEVMTWSEIMAIRNRSQGYAAVMASKSAKKVHPWITDEAEMAKKTVFKRATKWIPISSKVQVAIANDDEDYKTPRITKQPTTTSEVIALLENRDDSEEEVEEGEVVGEVASE